MNLAGAVARGLVVSLQVFFHLSLRPLFVSISFLLFLDMTSTPSSV